MFRLFRRFSADYKLGRSIVIMLYGTRYGATEIAAMTHIWHDISAARRDGQNDALRTVRRMERRSSDD